MKGLITLLLLAAVSVGVFALGKMRRDSDDKPILHVAEEVALTVEVAEPQRGRIVRLAQAPGDVEAVLEVDISSEVVSKIEEMPVEEGDRVKKGDLLCRLDDKNLRADMLSATERIAQLEAAIAQAEADVVKARRDCERQVRLSEADATSQIELLDYQTIRTKADAMLQMRQHELAQAQAMVKRIEEDLKRTVITSPIDGVVATLNAKQGEVVVTGTMNNPGTVIMTITDLSRMQVRARVDEVEAPLVQEGQTARVYLQSDPTQPVAARVARMAAKGIKQAGRDVVVFEALLDVLEMDDRVKPGMTCNVEIETAENDDAITIPVEAVVHRMRKELDEKIVQAYDEAQGALDLPDRARQAEYVKVIFVKDGESARVRVIKPGIADSRRVEILSGLKPDEAVITGPYRSLDQLKDGAKVALAKDEKKKEAADDDAEPDEQTAKSNEPDDANESDTDEEDDDKLAASDRP